MDEVKYLRDLFAQYSDNNLTEAIYLALRDAITSQALPDDTRLGELELAELFDVSRTPLQKALIRLELEELIVYENKRGYLVKQLDFKQCKEVNEMYLGLYTLSIILLGHRRLDRYYNQLLQQRLAMMKTETNLKEFLRLDTDFHMLITHSTGNLELINALNRTNAKSTRMYLFSRDCPLDTGQFMLRHCELNERMYDLMTNSTLQETVTFMEAEHNVHMKELVGMWLQPPNLDL